MHATNPIILIIWLVFLALGCFGGVYGIYNNRQVFGYSGGLCLFIAILLLKFVAF